MWPHILSRGLLLAVTLAGIGNVAGVHVYTGGNVEARNGTEHRLKCSFQSSSPVGKRTTVTWSFRPDNGGTEEVVMYYHEQPYPASGGRFKGRVVWSGNIWSKDVSITITDLRFSDNGTFLCAVLNPPDVDLVIGEVKLSVVHKVTYSEMLILGIVIGGATGLVVLIVMVMVTVQLCRKVRESPDEEEVEQEPWKGERGHESKDGSIAEQSLILTREEARF
ncbi:myelin protein zero-like protein 2 isoform X2 [Pristis pectinata]|uniref:myelin protein zero-like protein 2 isoform X2 n=1 Tax=Pristis pectinata TaxID=685728 RepID=UPI00223E1954|nr:myelin protein zero-like protein 2 isoform X2 [Pristis pectinata]